MDKDTWFNSMKKCMNAIITESDIKDICQIILKELLTLTGNNMGYVAELLFSDKGSPFFRYKAVAFKSKISSFNQYYKKHFIKNDNLDFYDMNTLYGLVYKTGTTVISNNIKNDPRRGGKSKIPKDHPKTNKFMGIPIFQDNNIIGMIGLSEPDNDKDYEEEDLKYIEPFCSLFSFALLYNKKREAINNSRNYFLLHMSHEIKTPLNGIIGMTQALLDTELSTPQLDIIKIISQCNLRLLNIINDIGDFYKITVGHVELEKKPVAVDSIITSVYEMYETDITNKKLEFVVNIDKSIDSDIITDKKRVKQILANLVSNAVNHTHSGSITIDVSLDNQMLKKYKKDNVDFEDTDVFIKFQVKDTGVGISKEKLKSIFHDFENLDNLLVVDTNTGRGLGLSICRLLIKVFEGTININSIVDIGTVVTFNIKAEKSDNLNNIKTQITKTLRGSYAMILNDDAEDRIKLSNLFISVGMIPIISNSMNEADIYLNNANLKFDVVVMSTNYINTNLPFKLKTLNSDVLIIGVSEITTNATIDHFLSINYKESDIIKCIYDHVKESIDIHAINDIEKDLSGDQSIKIKINNKTKSHVTDPVKNSMDMIGNDLIHILIAEDESANQKVINTALIKSGYNNVDIVSDGKLMLEAIKAKKYDVCFVDIRMPIMDGYEATERSVKYLKNKKKKLPFFIAVTALEDLDMTQKCNTVGINYVLKKPFSFSSIRKVMDIVKKQTDASKKNFTIGEQ